MIPARFAPVLFGLILSLGLLVDAAIVVIENIHRNYKHLGRQDKIQVSIHSASLRCPAPRISRAPLTAS